MSEPSCSSSSAIGAWRAGDAPLIQAGKPHTSYARTFRREGSASRSAASRGALPGPGLTTQGRAVPEPVLRRPSRSTHAADSVIAAPGSDEPVTLL